MSDTAQSTSEATAQAGPAPIPRFVRRSEPPPDPRSRLRAAIAEHRVERARLDALETSKDRLREEVLTAHFRMEEAKITLLRVEQDAPARELYSYVAGQGMACTVVDDVSGISQAAAHAQVEECKVEQARIERIERMLDTEIVQVTARLHRLESALRAALALAERCPRLAGAEGERMILPCSGEAGRLVCQVICQLMGTVSGGLRF